MKYKFISVFIAVILFHFCFHAPSPTYLRPGHPEWPVGWDRFMTFDSLKIQYPVLKRLGITCVGMTPEATSGREQEIVRFCRNSGMKIFLDGTRISTDRHDLQSLKDPETIQEVTQQLKKALSAWMRAAGGFPIDVIPAIHIQTSFKFPFSGQAFAGNQRPSDNDASVSPGDYNYYRIFQQITDQVVPGLLVLFPVNEFIGPVDAGVTIHGMTPVFLPPIHAFPSEKLRILRNVRLSWKRAGILCIPDVRETVLYDAERLPSNADSLFRQLRMIAPDAVVWEHPEQWPDSAQESIKVFHHFLQTQETSPDSN